MRRGTTPKHTFKTDVDLTDASVIYLTYKQGGKTVLTKELEDLTVTSEEVSLELTQQDTLMFSTKGGDVDMQIRARFPDGSAIASNIIGVKVNAILREGVI